MSLCLCPLGHNVTLCLVDDCRHASVLMPSRYRFPHVPVSCLLTVPWCIYLTQHPVSLQLYSVSFLSYIISLWLYLASSWIHGAFVLMSSRHLVYLWSHGAFVLHPPISQCLCPFDIQSPLDLNNVSVLLPYCLLVPLSFILTVLWCWFSVSPQSHSACTLHPIFLPDFIVCQMWNKVNNPKTSNGTSLVRL